VISFGIDIVGANDARMRPRCRRAAPTPRPVEERLDLACRPTAAKESIV
jgi:hypothetical protein